MCIRDSLSTAIIPDLIISATYAPELMPKANIAIYIEADMETDWKIIYTKIMRRTTEGIPLTIVKYISHITSTIFQSTSATVSYTHLDVYKRQVYRR